MRVSARRLAARRRETTGCASQVICIGLGLVTIALLFMLLVRPQISVTLGRRFADLLAPSVPTVDSADAPLPSLVAALPAGRVTVSEAEVNGYLTDIGATLPVEAVQVRFQNERAVISVQAYGMTGVISGGITVRDGRLAVLDPQVAGPLAMFLSAPDLTTVLNERLNAEFSRQDRQIIEARIIDGYLTIVTR